MKLVVNMRDVATAKRESQVFGNGFRNSKTGKFHGYWHSGRLQYYGEFKNGMKVGLWIYWDKTGTQYTEMYLNL